MAWNKKNAFYLPTVFLENTHNNGEWIKNTDTTWKSGKWNMNPTLVKLSQKANFYTDNNIDYILYSSKVKHLTIY